MSHRISGGAFGSVSKPHSYLLRIWRATDDRGAEVWRVLLRRADDPKAIGFANLEGLFAFLTDHYLGSSTPASPAGHIENERSGK